MAFADSFLQSPKPIAISVRFCAQRHLTSCRHQRRVARSHHPTGSMLQPPSLTPATPRKNLFDFTSPRHSSLSGHPTPISSSVRRRLNFNADSDLYSLTPLKKSSQNLILEPRRTPRTVSKVPYKVLDAPDLADDFYLNLVDWGNTDVLGVGLGSCVYTWNSASGRVTKLCELQDDTVTSVNWIQRVSIPSDPTSKALLTRDRARISPSVPTKAMFRSGTQHVSDDYGP